MEPNEQRGSGSVQRRGNKRAGQVCNRCHEKKIKCDIHQRSWYGRRCGNCENSGSVCQVRQPRRGRRSQCNESTAIRDNRTEKQKNNLTDATTGFNDSLSLPFTKDIPFIDLNSFSANSPTLAGPASSDERTDTTKPSVQLHKTHLGSTGYMQLFNNENLAQQNSCHGSISEETDFSQFAVSEDLIDSYLETYFEHAYTWCPVLDRGLLEEQPQIMSSLFLQNAVAVCGTRLRPPLIAHEDPETHYRNAKKLLYASCESNPILQIIGIMLFYWFSPVFPGFASLDTSRWWIATAVHLAEEIGLHQDIPPEAPYIGETTKMRRRIWWTLFARDRLVALAQGRPCVINLEYCNQPMITEQDFHDPTDRLTITFVHWVRLWEIGGRAHKDMYWSKERYVPRSGLVEELISWVQTLPSSIQLPFSQPRTIGYNRHVHDLHLNYLTIIILLYLQRNDDTMPTAYIPAIAAASCIGRIARDYLARGSVRIVMTHATWSIALAILCLLHARRIERLEAVAADEIQVLYTALGQLAPFSYPGKTFYQGIQKILDKENATKDSPHQVRGHCDVLSTPTADNPFNDSEIRWTNFFPYATAQTSPLIKLLLEAHDDPMTFTDIEWSHDILLLHELLDL